MDPTARGFNRRNFLKTSLIGAAGLSVFPLNSCRLFDDSVRLGFIGLGRQSESLRKSFIRFENVKVVGGADVYGIKRERFLQRCNDYYGEQDQSVQVTVYEDYQDLLNRKDIDAVIIASPDHWHAKMAIDACEKRKDIYLEKPLTLTIKEGQEVIRAVRRNDRVLAVGSQQRSDPNFQHAVKLVQDGLLGNVKEVEVFLGDVDPHPKPYDMPMENLPDGLNWNLWIGPLPDYHYNEILNPSIKLEPPLDEQFWGGWRWYKEFGGGLMTDWGAHMMDIAQWGLGFDLSGPVKVIPRGFEGVEYLSYFYEDGTKLIHKAFDGDTRGVKFIGDKGWIAVARGYFEASDPDLFPEEEVNPEIPYEGRAAHHVDFIESIRTHKDPAVPVEIGHHSCVACTLGNIAAELERPVQWDAVNERFVDDPVADKLLDREYLHGYQLV